MERPNPVLPTESLSECPDPGSAGPRQTAWAARRERLLAVAGYADTLVEAVDLVDRAYEEAAVLVRDARRNADAIRHTAERDAKQLTARAHEELARLEFQIAQLEAKRQLAEAEQRRRDLEPASLAEYPSEHGGRAWPDQHAPATAVLNPADLRDLTTLLRTAAVERAIEVTRSDVQSIPLVAESRRLQRHVVLNRPARPPVWPRTAAVVCVALATGVAVWWALVNPGARGVLQTTVAEQPLQARGVAPEAKRTEPPTRPSPTPAAVPSREPEKLSVSLRADRPTWIRTASDGVFDRGGFMAAGEKRLISGDRDVEVRTGDGGAVMVSVNGGPETPLGPNGIDAVKRFGIGAVAERSDASATTTPRSEREAERPSERMSVATTGTANRPAAPSGSVRDEIAAADARWFNALYGGADAALRALQAAEFELVDQRPTGDRPPFGAQIDREIRSIQIDTWADHAVVAGVMVEHVRGGTPREINSVFAETWVKRDSRWQLMGLRITPLIGSATSR
jgi:hypothetical protein